MTGQRWQWIPPASATQHSSSNQLSHLTLEELPRQLLAIKTAVCIRPWLIDVAAGWDCALHDPNKLAAAKDPVNNLLLSALP
jgi:hypothetical protein